MKYLRAILILLGFTIQGISATIIVDLAGGGDYTSITAAVDNANSGDSILIMSGTFQLSAPIEVDTELHIIGSGYDLPAQGGTYIIGSTQMFSFTVNADGSSLKGLRLNGNGSPMIAINADDMLIENNHLTNNYSQGWLMTINSTSNDTLRRNILTFNETRSYRPGIYFQTCINPLISNNILANFSWQGAIQFSNCTAATAANNIFLHCQYGVYNIGFSNVVNNIFMNNSIGLYVQSGSPSILNNCFFNNTTNGPTGVDAILDDPEFVDYASTDTYTSASYDDDGYDFHLQVTSPGIDGGYNLVDYNDLDATRNDLGVYGWSWPLGINGAPAMPLINQISVTPSGVAPGETISIEIIGRFGDE